jgi:hypothetical protein
MSSENESNLGGYLFALGLGFGAGVLATVAMEHTGKNERELNEIARHTAWQQLGREGGDYDPSDYAGIDHWSRKEVLNRADRVEQAIRTRYERGLKRGRRYILTGVR